MTISGPMAALLTPRDASGAFDADALRRNVAFVMERGSTGVCVNGATGEYTRATVEERRCAVEVANEALAGSGVLVAGCGGATWNECYTLAAHALDCGAQAVLVPTPHFFPYEDHDLEAFYTELARRLDGPILLYNLPQFTSGLPTAVAVRLIHDVASIVGIKDSSGSLTTLRELSANGFADSCRIVGHDAVLPEAFDEHCLDGIISGVAGVVPELNVALYEVFAAADMERRRTVLALQDELLEQLAPLPVPWALKIIAARRGLGAVSFPIPLSEKRKAQVRGFAAWFDAWTERASAIFALN
ncbi:MAG: dihydrodipicolinate synthase family protein [Bryobacterales bacterium]|nr:dihydrodipicolinate synthase family protein [Bryobacterales bacterium]